MATIFFFKIILEASDYPGVEQLEVACGVWREKKVMDTKISNGIPKNCVFTHSIPEAIDHLLVYQEFLDIQEAILKLIHLHKPRVKKMVMDTKILDKVCHIQSMANAF